LQTILGVSDIQSSFEAIDINYSGPENYFSLIEAGFL